jgi:hypothetical protein
MDQYRFLAGPAYLVAFTLVAVPLFDALTQLGGLNPGSSQWRFGAIGLMSNAFLIPAAGLLIALAAAKMLGHGRFLRVFGALCGLGSALAVVVLLLFALDAVQTRANVQPAARFAFLVASLTAAAKLILAIGTLAAMARAGLRTPLLKPGGKSRERAPLASVGGGAA